MITDQDEAHSPIAGDPTTALLTSSDLDNEEDADLNEISNLKETDKN